MGGGKTIIDMLVESRSQLAGLENALKAQGAKLTDRRTILEANQLEYDVKILEENS